MLMQIQMQGHGTIYKEEEKKQKKYRFTFSCFVLLFFALSQYVGGLTKHGGLRRHGGLIATHEHLLAQYTVKPPSKKDRNSKRGACGCLIESGFEAQGG